MNQTLPERASAVVIGGGVTGTSVAYHLAKLGWSDVVLLERQQFASGTSWHAAGLIGTARHSDTHAGLCAYTRNLLPELEAETGQSTGFRQVGSVAIAHSRDRFAELKRLADSYNAFGFGRMEVITAEEVGHFHPLVRTDDLLGGTWLEIDGMASPVDVVSAYVKGARGRGVRCIENVKVTGIRTANGRVSGVETETGDIACEFVVCAAGLWSRQLGRLAGVTIPLHACEHYYAHTEKLADLPSDLPVLRDQDKCAYYREDAGSLLVGAFEPNARPIRLDAIPEDFCFDELPGHMEEQLMPILADAMERVPMLQEVGWRSFFCGPESFTHDDQFHVGESPELGNFYVACGLNSVGIVTSGGIGKACAEWMDKGHPPLDLTANDPAPGVHLPGRPGLHRGTGDGDPGAALRPPLPLPPVRLLTRRAALAGARAARRARRMLRRSGGLGAAELVRARGRRAPLRVQLLPPELVRVLRGRAPRGARGRRPVRPVELLEVPRQGP